MMEELLHWPRCQEKKEGAVICFGKISRVFSDFSVSSESYCAVFFEFSNQNTMNFDKLRFGAVICWPWQCAKGGGRREEWLERIALSHTAEIRRPNMTKQHLLCLSGIL